MNAPRVTYKRSYLSKMIQSESTVQNYYSALKNKLLSYKGVKPRISFNYESFNKGRVPCAKINIKGKTLVMYLALKPSDYVGTKYFFTDVSSIAKYESVPMLIKVKSDRGLKYAFQLIEDMMGKHLGLAATVQNNIDYTMPYETDEQLVARGLIKLGGTKTAIAAATAVIEEQYGPINETPSYDDIVPTAPVVEDSEENEKPKKTATKTKKAEKQVEKVDEESVSVSEEIKAVNEVAVVEEEKTAVEPKAKEITDAQSGLTFVDITEELMKALENDDMIFSLPLVESKNEKAIVNIDVIEETFAEGETVSLETLKERNIIAHKVTYLKILARGILTKAVNVKADKYSQNAKANIVAAGGKAE